MKRSVDPAARTPDRIAADVFLTRAKKLEGMGKHAEAHELRTRAGQLVGDVTVRSRESTRGEGQRVPPRLRVSRAECCLRNATGLFSVLEKLE